MAFPAAGSSFARYSGGTGGFGSDSTAQTQPKMTFGGFGQVPQNTSAFGTPAKANSAFGIQREAFGGGFGQTKATATLFGAAASTAPLFGQASTSASFGQTAPSQPATQTGRPVH